MERYLTGYHVLEEYLKGKNVSGILYISKKNRRNLFIEEAARNKGLKVQYSTDSEIARMIKGAEHRGVLLITHSPGDREPLSLNDALSEMPPDKSLVLVLDEITDPHNFGAILRSADQFAADLVVYQERRNARETDTVARTSAGAVEYVKKACVPNISRALEELKERGYWIYGADMAGESLYTLKFSGKVALVLGSEGKGLRKLVREKCDILAAIPTYGRIDSLNVSVATGVMLYEVRKQLEISMPQS